MILINVQEQVLKVTINNLDSNNDYNTLKRHKFFEGIDFNNLSYIDPPFKTNMIESPSSKKSPELRNLKSCEFTCHEDLGSTNLFKINMNYIGGDDEEFKMKTHIETPKDTEEIKLDIFNSAENITTEDKSNETTDSRKEEIIYERNIIFKQKLLKKNLLGFITIQGNLFYFLIKQNISILLKTSKKEKSSSLKIVLH